MGAWLFRAEPFNTLSCPSSNADLILIPCLGALGGLCKVRGIYIIAWRPHHRARPGLCLLPPSIPKEQGKWRHRGSVWSALDSSFFNAFVKFIPIKQNEEDRGPRCLFPQYLPKEPPTVVYSCQIFHFTILLAHTIYFWEIQDGFSCFQYCPEKFAH